MKTAWVFPGQGSQAVGMGKALAEAFAPAREVFEEVDDALSAKLSALMFEGPESDLTLTANTQPAILACSVAVLRVLQKEAGIASADFVAGHSLGEYSALVAAESLSLREAAQLVRTRGAAMQEAVPAGQGGMAAIIGLEMDAVEALATEASTGGEVVEVANDNAPGQLVISGSAKGIEAAVALAKDKGAKRALLLPVSAPFHCSLMTPAAEVMREALAAADVAAPKMPVVANISAQPVRDAEAIVASLVAQVTGRVRWVESMQWLRTQGVERMIEMGHGNVLAGLQRRIDKDVAVVTIAAPEDIDAWDKAA